MSQWYYTRDRQQVGPVSEMEIRQLISDGQIPETALAWTDGMADWQPVSSIAALAASPETPELPTPTPPPSAGGSTPAPGPSTPQDPANPYAAPSSDMGQTAGAPPSGFDDLEEIIPGSQPIEIGACIARGFELTKRHFGTILVIALIVIGISMAVSGTMSFIDSRLGWGQPGDFPDFTGEPELDEALDDLANQGSILNQLVTALVDAFLGLGILRIGLNIVSSQPVAINQLFSQGGKTIRAFFGEILFGLMVGVGLILLIVPGIYLALRFGQYKTAIVDKDMGIFEAFNYSSQITQANKLPLLGLFILSMLIVLGGALALIVGLLFALPLVQLAAIVAYRWMQFGAAATQER